LATTLLPNIASTIGSWARFIAQGLEQNGIDSRQLFLDAGIDLDESESPNVRFPVSNMSRVWQLAVERSGDPCIALSIASNANPSMYSALGLSMISSRTIGEALSRGSRFSQIASDAANVVMREFDDRYDLVYQMSPEEEAVLRDEALEAFMASSLCILRSISKAPFKPLEVHFRHDREEFRQRYEDFFAAPVFFSSGETRIVLSRESMEIECLQANPELADNMERWMAEYLAGFSDGTLSFKVCHLLAKKLPDGELKQDDVASALAMSTRSLQRGLQKERVSFKELLDKTRQDLALKYIGEKRLSLIEICCLLGFSDQSNFTKAFKRWTGHTPNAYRQDLWVASGSSPVL